MSWLLAEPAVLLAATGEELGRVTYEWSRLSESSDPRLLGMGIALGVLVLLAAVGYLYRRDTVELSAGWRALLYLLRATAFAGLVVFYLGLEKRTAREVTTNGQVVVLADVSQSMGLTDSDDSGVPAGPIRSEQVAAALGESPLIEALREQNDVIVARFDQQVDRLLTLDRRSEVDPAGTVANPDNRSPVDADQPSSVESLDWQDELLPRGTETRIGDAIGAQLEEHRSAPLAGIVVFSDGVQNAGLDAEAAGHLAQDAQVPVFTVGIGSTEPPRSLAIHDLVAPRRAYPGDQISLTAYLRSSGFNGRFVEVQLTRRQAGDDEAASVVVDQQRVVLGGDDEVVPARFEFEPGEVGRFSYAVNIDNQAGDVNTRDNQREVEIDVVDHRTRVLVIAGGPSRDYRFLRTVLFRDPSMEVDVWLQSSPAGISQEADRILDEFPADRESLYEYDCIVAIDPNWLALDAADIEILDSWVGDEAGGMIVVAGPVHTADWIRSSEHRGIRSLYPVDFQQRLTLLDDGHYAGETPWPLEFERAGREAEFLWLEESAEESQAAWDSFDGVYGYYALRGAKPGATIYARFTDPEVAFGGEPPVYMASHFYGAGRVFYAGSAEFWRLRMEHTHYFDRLWVKLIRHVSQGRLLRGSSRGTLFVERDRYELGEAVAVRARLSNQRYEPLEAAQVVAQVLRPDGIATALQLDADVDQPGMFAGQFHVMQEGPYEIVLAVPDQVDQQLTRQIQARIPDRERLNPIRNETLLASMAETTGGLYYPQLDSAIYGTPDLPAIAAQIPDRTETNLIQGAPDEEFAQNLRRWLLGVICGALLCEWTIRRLCRLA